MVFKRLACGWVGGTARAVPMTVTHLPVENNDLGTLYAIFVFRDITAISSESTDFLQFFYFVGEFSRPEVWRKRSPIKHS